MSAPQVSMSTALAVAVELAAGATARVSGTCVAVEAGSYCQLYIFPSASAARATLGEARSAADWFLSLRAEPLAVTGRRLDIALSNLGHALADVFSPLLRRLGRPW